MDRDWHEVSVGVTGVQWKNGTFIVVYPVSVFFSFLKLTFVYIDEVCFNFVEKLRIFILFFFICKFFEIK